MTIGVFDLVFSGVTDGFGYWWVGVMALFAFLLILISSVSGADVRLSFIFAFTLFMPGVLIGLYVPNVVFLGAVLLVGVIFGIVLWQMLRK